MTLRPTTVRFYPEAFSLVRDEARDAGVPVAVFVREAAIMRAVLRAARREQPGMPLDFQRLCDEVERRAKVD